MTDDPSKNDQQTGKPGLFEPGGPGGPGRPVGSRNRATLALDALAEGEGETILRQVMEAAKGGDMRAAEIILGRIWPARKGRLVSLKLPSIKTAQDLVAAVGAVADAVAGGEITADEGQAVAAVLEVKRRALEIVDVIARIEELEKARAR